MQHALLSSSFKQSSSWTAEAETPSWDGVMICHCANSPKLGSSVLNLVAGVAVTFELKAVGSSAMNLHLRLHVSILVADCLFILLQRFLIAWSLLPRRAFAISAHLYSSQKLEKNFLTITKKIFWCNVTCSIAMSWKIWNEVPVTERLVESGDYVVFLLGEVIAF